MEVSVTISDKTYDVVRQLEVMTDGEKERVLSFIAGLKVENAIRKNAEEKQKKYA